MQDWGEGYFIAVGFDNFSTGLTYENVKVGLYPSAGSGLITLDGDKAVITAGRGPMTNIGALLRKHPGIKDKIGRVYAMIASKDGAGNITPYAEFNSYCDPQALYDLVSSGIETVFAPMHLGRESKLSTAELLRSAGNTDMAAMMKDMFDGYCDSAAGDGYVAMYDANAAEALTRPELYDFIRCTATVNVTDRPGQTFLTPDGNGGCFYIEIKDKEKLAAAMFDDMFSD